MKAPNTLDDFMNQATSFVNKARAEGVDDNKISNTIRFMYTLTQQNIVNNQSNEMTPYQKASEERLNRGNFAYNSDTGEYYNDLTGESKAAPNSDTSISGSDFGFTAPNPSNSVSKSMFDFDKAASEFSLPIQQSSQEISQPKPRQTSVTSGSPFLDSLSDTIFGFGKKRA